MAHPFVTPVAKSIPFDNETNGFTSTDAQAAIEETKNVAVAVVSPGFTWGRSGNIPTNTYLLNDTVPSNLTGRIVPFAGLIDKIYVSCENTSTFTVTVQKRSGASFVDLFSASLSAERIKVSSPSSVAVSALDELSIKITSGSCKNPVVGIVIKGST